MSENRGRRGGKSNAERKREHDTRQRALGRRQRNYWTTDEEDQALRKLLEEMRKSGDRGEG